MSLRERLPSFIFYPLWWVKHRVLTYLASHRLTEYRQHRLQTLLRQEQISLALDVGANTGQYAKMLRRLGFRGRIISFEPMRDNARRLAHAARRDKLWSIQPIALGAERASVAANVTQQSELSSLLPPSEFGKRMFASSIAVSHVETVEVHRLDDLWDTLVPDREERVHLKIDTQGFERFVLEGASASLPGVRTVEVELSMQALYEGQPGWTEMTAFLYNAGFQLAGMYPVTRAANGSVVDADCLFVRPQ